jgi:arginase
MKKRICLIAVPYDSARFNERMGAGPLHIINAGLIEKLQSLDYQVTYQQIKLEDAFPTEIATSMKLMHQIKCEVNGAVQQSCFPIVLSGNCSATVGVVAGLKENQVGVLWFDAHGDAETPETTESGFLDGMGLSMLTFSCWQTLLSHFDLRSGMAGNDIILLGARDLSSTEESFISSNCISYITVDEIKEMRGPVIEAACSHLIHRGIKKLHLHIDVDVIDPSVTPANAYAVFNGVSKEDLFETIDLFATEMSIASLTIASYDPMFDTDNRMLAIINELIEKVIQHADD